MRTVFEFVLPRGYVDDSGTVHKRGTMRLATARDELQPLRDPTITGPDDPRLTLLVLVRVIESLGSLQMVTMHEIEGLFAADLAYLQDFYGVINFGSDTDIDALLAAQSAQPLQSAQAQQAAQPAATEVSAAPRPSGEARGTETTEPVDPGAPAEERPAVNGTTEPRAVSRRMAVQEVPSGSR